MISMKPKDAIKLDIGGKSKSETHPKEAVLPKDRLYRYINQQGNKMEIKKTSY